MVTLLTKKEIAIYLGVSERTIENYMEERTIPYFKLNGIVRFDPNQVQRWLKSKEVVPAGRPKKLTPRVTKPRGVFNLSLKQMLCARN